MPPAEVREMRCKRLRMSLWRNRSSQLVTLRTRKACWFRPRGSESFRANRSRGWCKRYEWHIECSPIKQSLNIARKTGSTAQEGIRDPVTTVMNYREEIMSLIVPGQFDDADTSDSEPSQVVPASQEEKVVVKIQESHLNEEADVDESDESSEDEEGGWDWDDEMGKLTKTNPMPGGRNLQANKQTPSSNAAKMSTPTDKALRKFENKINLDKLCFADSVINKVTEKSRQREADMYRVKDKSDRATVEQVLDPRTRMILFKMLSRGVISEINGCVSTGKEANVYHASTAKGENRAIKIYKTSILMFKDRDKYVSGEFR
ncbi:putative Serine-threonine-protein [Naja naja]|nr:putative Serine-threonine-protein [Naja naja]